MWAPRRRKGQVYSRCPLWVELFSTGLHVILSKADLTRTLRCKKLEYLFRNEPALGNSESFSNESLKDQGVEVGLLARELFINGHDLGHIKSLAEASAETRELIQTSGTLFEAAFETESTGCRVDILETTSQGLDIFEVKSSTKNRPDYLIELAFQWYTIVESGHTVRDAYLIHIHPGYVLPEGREIVAKDFFVTVKQTDEVRAILPQIKEQVRAVKAMLSETFPPIQLTDSRCRNPYKCPFHDHCHADVSDTNIQYLPSLTADDVENYRKRGIHDISQIPESKDLSLQQAKVRQVITSGQPHVSPRAKSLIRQLRYPIAFIDFEAANPAIPLLPGMKPYQPLPFQWSCHILKDHRSEPVHLSFLGLDEDDPRAAFVQSLEEALRDVETIIHYSDYEITLLGGLKEQGYSAAGDLAVRMKTRGCDLHRVLRENIYLQEFKGSFSIKNVLPALVPDVSYDSLAIGDGLQASAAFLEVRKNPDPAKREQTRRDLLEYCRLDTWAMVLLKRRILEMTPNQD